VFTVSLIFLETSLWHVKKTFIKEHMTGHCGNRVKCALVYDLEKFIGNWYIFTSVITVQGQEL
jgi:hypothetical protein